MNSILGTNILTSSNLLTLYSETSEASVASGRLGQHLPSPAYSSCARNPLPCAKLPSTPCACALIRRFAHHFLAALARLWSVPARSVAFCVSVAAGFPPCLCRNSGLSIRCSERRVLCSAV